MPEPHMAVTAGSVTLLRPADIKPNPENPRLIFRAEDLQALQESIAEQGVLVPLTVYTKADHYVILDGERRWRCALKLGLPRLPAIVQPEPSRFQNILMMFAIHNARKDWDPLPTAYKLKDLEAEFLAREDRRPTEQELAQLASMTRGEVRRLKKLLNLPQKYRDQLMAELEKPRSKQILTVDLVLETTKGVEALVKRGIIHREQEDDLRSAIIDKYQAGVITNTVEPRQLARIARAVERDEISIDAARTATKRILREPSYGIQQAFNQAAANADRAHNIEQQADRLSDNLRSFFESGYELTDSLRVSLAQLDSEIAHALGRRR